MILVFIIRICNDDHNWQKDQNDLDGPSLGHEYDLTCNYPAELYHSRTKSSKAWELPPDPKTQYCILTSSPAERYFLAANIFRLFNSQQSISIFN